MYRDSQRIEAELSAIFQGANSLADLREEKLQGSLARYACILASSYVEVSLREAILAYAAGRASPKILQYVDSTFVRGTNYNTDRIRQLLCRFSPEHGNSFDRVINGEMKDNLDSIRANRNDIAHGRRSGISLGQVKRYFGGAKALLAGVRQILDLT